MHNIDINFPSWSSEQICCIINAYEPTQKRSLLDPKLAEFFYGDLKTAINIPARHELFILADFDSKLGLRTSVDEAKVFQEYLGRYGMGQRNENGELLLEFMCKNQLFATDTGFKHPSRHRTTLTGWQNNWAAG